MLYFGINLFILRFVNDRDVIVIKTGMYRYFIKLTAVFILINVVITITKYLI